MKIYIVTAGYYSAYGIEAVFTERELAEKYCNDNGYFDSIDEYHIEEYDADTKHSNPPKMAYAHGIFVDGKLVYRHLSESTKKEEGLITYTTHRCDPKRLEIELCVKIRQNETCDQLRERATKILTDQYYQYLLEQKHEETT